MTSEKPIKSFPAAGKTVWKICMCTCLLFIAFGFILNSPEEIIDGLITYVKTPDILVTDYFVVGSPGAAFVNCGIVTLISIVLLWKTGTPFTGGAIAQVFIMAGFALFGKNPVNILPFFLGVYVYCRVRKIPMRRHTGAALYSSALAPIVTDVMSLSYLPFWARTMGALMVGAFIGYIIIPVANHSFSTHMGYTLFNYGFAGGLIALVFASLVSAMGHPIATVLIWQKGIDFRILLFTIGLCLMFIITGLYYSRWKITPFLRIMRHSGRAHTDYVMTDGIGATFVNMGAVGLIFLIYILLIGGDLNGPVLGALLTCIGFAAVGEHPKNIIPIIIGVYLATLFMTKTASDPSMQLAALFGMALCPIAGQFGAFYGIIAGIMHSALVTAIAGPCGGYNLYNNGFSAGLTALVMVSLIQGFSKKWKNVEL